MELNLPLIEETCQRSQQSILYCRKFQWIRGTTLKTLTNRLHNRKKKIKNNLDHSGTCSFWYTFRHNQFCFNKTVIQRSRFLTTKKIKYLVEGLIFHRKFVEAFVSFAISRSRVCSYHTLVPMLVLPKLAFLSFLLGF